MAYDSERTIEVTKANCPVHRNVFATRDMPFEFEKGMWIQYLKIRIYFFGIQSLEADDVWLKWCSSSVASVAEE